MFSKNKMAKSARHHNTVWVFFLALVVSGAMVGLYVYPTYQSLEQVKAETVLAEQEIAKQTRALAVVQEASKNPQPTQQELLLNTQVTAQPDKTELVRYLEGVTPYRYVAAGQKTLLKSFTVRDEGVPAARIVPNGEHAAAGNGTQPGSIAVQGVLESSKAAFLQFLSELERTDRRLFTVNQLSWREARDAKTPLTSEIQFTVNMQTYYQPVGTK